MSRVRAANAPTSGGDADAGSSGPSGDRPAAADPAPTPTADAVGRAQAEIDGFLLVDGGED